MVMDETCGPCLHFRIDDTTRAGEARRAATALAEDLRFDATRAGEVAIVVSEVAKNLAAHARGGELFVRRVDAPGGDEGIEVLALDSGPGMPDVSRCIEDGYSTAGTTGIGLGAISRLSSAFDLFSLVDSGTVLWSRLFRRGSPASRDHPPAAPGRLDVGVVCAPKPGETACGDGYAILEQDGHSRVLVADGLGHGLAAQSAAREAIRVFREQSPRPPDELLHLLHGALRATRGAAIAIADIDWAAREVHFVGVGNVAALILDAGTARNLVSHNGTVGHQLRKVQVFVYPFPASATLLMHTDGLQTQWKLARYPGLLTRPPATLAATLYRDYRRGRDDVLVLAVRPAAAPATSSATPPATPPSGAPS